jgi:uncharacterized membrane protein YraQ (UPF0718 family)
MKTKKRKISADYPIIISFVIFVAYSYYGKYAPGIKIFEDNFLSFMKEMILALPVMFILVGLFDVWVPKEKVQKHIGNASGIKGVLWVILLAFMQAGPLYAAFPVAYILRKKGTSAVNIFIYLGASSIAKIPMVTFEIGFLGLKFSLLRIFLSLPVFILIGIMMGNYFEKNKCTINDV